MITKIQVPQTILKLWENPEEFFITRQDILNLIMKVNQEEMEQSRHEWNNFVFNTFQTLVHRPGPIPPSDLCYLKSSLTCASDTSKERMAELINENFFSKASEKVEPNPLKKPKSDELKKPRAPRKKIPNALRLAVWNDFAKYTEICFCCKREKISIANFECGHVVSVKNGGSDTIQNLRPICSQCNRSMGTKNMLEFISSCGF